MAHGHNEVVSVNFCDTKLLMKRLLPQNQQKDNNLLLCTLRLLKSEGIGFRSNRTEFTDPIINFVLDNNKYRIWAQLFYHGNFTSVVW